MTELYTKDGRKLDWNELEIAAQKYPHVTHVHKFGRNPSVSTTGEDIWETGGHYVWPSTGFLVSAISASTEDSAAGIGARTLVLSGLSTDFEEQTEEINLNGAAEVTSTGTFIRLNSAYVNQVGAYAQSTAGSNEGVITIYDNGTTSYIQATINSSGNIGAGQTEIARYTIPANKRGYLVDMHIDVDSAKNTATIALYQRRDADNTTTFTGKRLIHEFDGVSGPDEYIPRVPLGPFPPKTDIWAHGIGSTGSNTDPEVDVEFALVLEDIST